MTLEEMRGKTYGHVEIKDQEELLSKHVFVTDKSNSVETKTILEENFHVVRPQTLLFDENETRMILVYLPTKIKVESNKENSNTKKIDYANTACFVIHRPKEKTEKKKIMLSWDSIDLKENFKLDVLPVWENVRWKTKDIDSWIEQNEPIEAKKVYELLDKAIRKYIDFPEDYNRIYFNLWIIGTYFYELFEAYPGTDLTGTKRAGKSKVLEFLKYVCFNALMSPDMTGSSLFRIVEGTGATMLLDETENFRDKKNETAQLVRRLIMQGMLRGQHVIRSESKDNSFTPKTYNIYSPKAMAHISSLDDVMQDRFIKLIMKRTKSKELLNIWPDKKDPAFQQIRNYCYRLFLDYAYEIYDLQKEAQTKCKVSGRELQLWTPIMTLALFFEKHGVMGIIESIQNFTGISSHSRQLEDEETNYDLKILKFIDKEGVKIATDPDINTKNVTGWITIQELYDRLVDDINSKEYEINPEYFKRKHLTATLQRLGFESERKTPGISYHVTRNIVNEIKERMGMENEETQTEKKLHDRPKPNSLDGFKDT
ncbi:MAG: hypothetical protein WD018_05435 [Nitrosopumilaceae archaeon]